MDMCADGLGLIIVPSFGVEDDLRSGRVVPLLSDHQLPTFRLHVRYPSKRFLPAKVRSFLEALREHFGPDPDADIWWPVAGAPGGPSASRPRVRGTPTG
jgi:DNA-binding transcriptional LysR family regulator